MSLAQRFGAIARPDLIAATKRFPVSTAAALVATAIIVLRIEHVLPRESLPLERTLFGLETAFVAGVAARIGLEARGRLTEIVLGQVVAAALGLCAAVSLFSLWLTPAMLIGSLTLFALTAPGLSVGGTPVRFWIFNVRSTFAALVGAVGTGAFVLGFWAILATLRSLFDVTAPDRLVSDAAAVGVVLVLPLYWLAFQPRIEEIDIEEPAPDILTRALAALTDFVFLPLLVVYTVILHVYAAKIAANAALPRGQVGWMVSIFLGLGYLAFLLAVSQQSPLPVLRRFFRLGWPPATLVPAGLLALALRERVQEYGWTEDRYLLGLIALCAALLILAWLPRRRLDPRLIRPLLPACSWLRPSGLPPLGA